MNVLLIHQNMPGQFKHLAPALARRGHRVAFITKRQDVRIPGVQTVSYQPSRTARRQTHHYVQRLEESVLHGQQVVRACQALGKDGFRPDVVLAHPGWGEALFVKDVFPRAPLISYCEFYYSARGADLGFDPEFPATLDSICRARVRNAHLLLSLEAADRGWSPTDWQKSRHPAAFQSKISTIFDGIDTAIVGPNPSAQFTLPNGKVLTRSDEVITYVARNLEPYRGFPSFIRALPRLLLRRPQAEIVIVGGDEVSYGTAPEGGGTWREVMAKEVPLPPGRVHFMGRIPYSAYLSLLQISSVHVYLTYPFVLSWSFMEAMAAQCLLVASKTAPVEEFLRPGENGLFTDFFDPAQIAEDVVAALDHPDRDGLRHQARETILGRCDLATCLPRQLDLIAETAGRAF